VVEAAPPSLAAPPTPYYERNGITIFHGDCRDILPHLGPVDLVLTDPPYGIALEEHGRSGYDWTIQGDSSSSLGESVLSSVANLPTVTFAPLKRPWPGKWRQILIWDKGPAVGGGGDPLTCFKQTAELIQFRNTGHLNGGRDSAVLRFWIAPNDYHYHPVEKPLPLIRYLIQKFTRVDETILDPFMGSGTTLRAAKDLGRRAIGIEIEERYCEIAVKRLAQEVLC